MKREHWGSQFGFIMAAAGSAIGLGTLWMFPFLTGENGGGLFVLIYLFCTFFIGVPIFIAELVIGRKAQRGAVGVFSVLSEDSKGWIAVGWLGVAASFLIMSYYSTVAGWGINYICMSLVDFYQDRSMEEISNVFEVLYRSGDINIFWHSIFTLITVGVVSVGVRNGIERWSRIMTSSLLVILVGLFLYSTTLSGFGDAVHFIFYPNLSNFKPSGALEALGLSFYTLSLGQGIMITYGSYMNRTENIPKISIIIGFMDVLISLLVALMIFPIIFTFGFEPQGGAGLIFKSLPVLFNKLPGTQLISVTFFLLFVFTALTSAVALIEVVVANFMDLYSIPRKKATLWVGLATFIVGIPSALSGSQGIFSSWFNMYGHNFFETISYLVATWIIPLGGCFTAIFVGWRLDKEMCYDELNLGSGMRHFAGIWMFLLRWVVPVAILAVLLYKAELIDFDKILK